MRFAPFIVKSLCTEGNCLIDIGPTWVRAPPNPWLFILPHGTSTQSSCGKCVVVGGFELRQVQVSLPTKSPRHATDSGVGGTRQTILGQKTSPGRESHRARSEARRITWGIGPSGRKPTGADLSHETGQKRESQSGIELKSWGFEPEA